MNPPKRYGRPPSLTRFRTKGSRLLILQVRSNSASLVSRPSNRPLALASNYFSVVRSRQVFRTLRRHHSQAWNLSRLVHRASPRSPTLAGICPTGRLLLQETTHSGRFILPFWECRKPKNWCLLSTLYYSKCVKVWLQSLQSKVACR